jgi:hypothetical protein
MKVVTFPLIKALGKAMTHRDKDHSTIDRKQKLIGYRDSAAFLMLLLLINLPAMLPSSQVYGRTGDLIPQSTQEPSGAGNQQGIPVLERGNPIRRELAGGQEHSYRITLIADLFLKVWSSRRG